MTCSIDNLDSKLVAFQQGDPGIRETLPSELYPSLLKWAQFEARDLDNELHRDVVQHAWMLLLRKDLELFDPSRSSACTYLQFIVKRAATDVRAQNTPPGQRTRLQRDSNGERSKQQPALSWDAEMPTGSAGNSVGVLTLADVFGDPIDRFARLEAQDEAFWLLQKSASTADSAVYHALDLIYREEATLTDAAKTIPIHRSTLRRRIDRWVAREGITRVA